MQQKKYTLSTYILVWPILLVVAISFDIYKQNLNILAVPEYLLPGSIMHLVIGFTAAYFTTRTDSRRKLSLWTTYMGLLGPLQILTLGFVLFYIVVSKEIATVRNILFLLNSFILTPWIVTWNTNQVIRRKCEFYNRLPDTEKELVRNHSALFIDKDAFRPLWQMTDEEGAEKSINLPILLDTQNLWQKVRTLESEEKLAINAVLNKITSFIHERRRIQEEDHFLYNKKSATVKNVISKRDSLEMNKMKFIERWGIDPLA